MKPSKKSWWPAYVHKTIKSKSLGMDPGHSIVLLIPQLIPMYSQVWQPVLHLSAS